MTPGKTGRILGQKGSEGYQVRRAFQIANGEQADGDFQAQCRLWDRLHEVWEETMEVCILPKLGIGPLRVGFNQVPERNP